MQYTDMVPGVFLRRPNRFIAHIVIAGREEVCHVKNTGRCRELLQPGAQVWCQKSGNPARKTQYDLIAVEKGGRLINMDSQAPNAAAKEWLLAGGLGEISGLRPEYTQGDSRFDFSFYKDGKQCFLEVKGVTLENDGVCAFPDAPTVRGARHLRELKQLKEAGYGAYILFVIQMAEAVSLQPNDATDPVFGQALREAAAAGVVVLARACTVYADAMVIAEPVPLLL